MRHTRRLLAGVTTLMLAFGMIAGAGAALAQGPPPGAGHAAAACDATVSPGDNIQDAVDSAASGDTVCVDPGTYEEQVVINKDLSLTGAGAGSTTIMATSTDRDVYEIAESSGSSWQPVVLAYGGSDDGSGSISGAGQVSVDVSGFTVDGADLQPEDRGVGVLYRNVEGSVADNVVQNMGVGGKETMGILVYGDSDVTISGNDVSGYERGGIGANGDGGVHPSPNVTVTDNHVTGSTGIGVAWAPNGIQVGFGATGSVTGNVVEDNRWSGTGWVASCILVFESDDVTVRGNHISNCDVGVSVGSWGWFLPSADNIKVMGNTVQESIGGIVLQAVAWDGFTSADPSVDNAEVVNNDLDGGAIGDVGIAVSAVDSDPVFDPSADDNKVINNDIDGFDTPIDDQGTNTKASANSPSLP